MKDAPVLAKVGPQSAAARQSDVGPDGASAAPPGYGIDFLDRQRPNRTGLPGQLKAGIEQLSGLSLDDVRVHYNSGKPSLLQARAYTQGTEIYVGPGQERHVPHEAWHVVQQKQGRVRETARTEAGAVNNDPALEREAESWSVRAAAPPSPRTAKAPPLPPSPAIIQRCGPATSEEKVFITFFQYYTKNDKNRGYAVGHIQLARNYKQHAQENNWKHLEEVASKYLSDVEDAIYAQNPQPERLDEQPDIKVEIPEEIQPAPKRNLNSDQPQPVKPNKPGRLGSAFNFLKRLFNKSSLKESVTANSPGIYTGSAGAASLVPTLANAKATASPVPGYLGAVANPLSMLGDVVALKDAYSAVRSANSVLSSEESTNAQKKLARTQRKGAALDAVTQGADLLAQGSGLAGTVASQFSSPLAATIGNVAGPAASFLSAPVGLAVGARAAWRAGKAGAHRRKLDTLLGGGKGENASSIKPLGSLVNEAKFARNQMRKREARQAIGAVGAALGVGGALALGIGAVAGGAALMATPVGWALAGAGTLAALGIGAHKLYRHIKKTRADTLGGQRRETADKLHKALTGQESGQDDAKKIVAAMGLKPEDVETEGGLELLEEKLKGW